MSWTRVRTARLCGRCGQRMAEGDALQVIQVQGLRRPLVRCVACVGPAPPDLPALEVTVEPTYRPMLSMRSLASELPADFKSAQAGDREPGEDG